VPVVTQAEPLRAVAAAAVLLLITKTEFLELLTPVEAQLALELTRQKPEVAEDPELLSLAILLPIQLAEARALPLQLQP
jgi:hypothetical protein